MALKFFVNVCLAVFSISVAHGLSAHGSDTWVGKRVMVVRPNAEFRVGSEAVGAAPLGSVLVVSEVNDPWLAFQGGPGWLMQSDVVVYDKAIEHFTAAVQRNPNANTYHQRGLALVALGQFDKAVSDFGQAIRYDAKNMPAYNDRGNAYRKLGNLDEALADFNKAIDSGVQHPAVYVNRGLVWHDKGDFDRALADYNQALGLDAKFAPAWEAGGSTRQAKGDYAKAISNFTTAIQHDDEFDLAHNNLAWILATCPDGLLRDGKSAVAHATKACNLSGYQDADYLDTLATAHAEAAQFEQAVSWAKDAIEKAPNAQKPAIEDRLKLYEAGKPFRESKASH